MSDQYWISDCSTISEETLSVLNDYLLALKLENKAEETIKKYKTIIERFLTEIPTSIESLTSEHVLTWLNKFAVDKAPRTIDLYLSCLSTFFHFCIEEDLMEQMILKKRWRPKILDALPKYLTEEEYARVRIAAEDLSLRDRAVVLFLFSSGCRRSELSNLSIKDVKLDKRTAQVRGKGDKLRYVHFSTECSVVLSEYLNTRTYTDSDPLFMNKFGDYLGTAGIFKIVKQLGEMAGLSQNLNPHMCRHTFATNMMARGADLGFIADELGHSDLNTTRVYARIPTEDMITAYQNRME